MKVENTDVNFNQYVLYDYVNDTENHDLFIKLINNNGISHSSFSGCCYGLTDEFLVYSMNNQGGKYIEQLNELYSIINSNDDNLTPLDKARNDALKLHAKSLFNEHVSDVIKKQLSYIKSVRHYNYIYNFKYEEINGRSFVKYINDIVNTNYAVSKSMYGREANYYNYLAELQKLKIKIYTDALLADADSDFFKTKAGKDIASDELFIKLKDKLSIGGENLASSFTTDDAKIFINTISEVIQRDNYLELEDNRNGKGVQVVDSKNFTTHLANETTLSRFKEKIYSHINTSNQPLLIKFCSASHAMAISIIYDQKTKVWTYKFFDPDTGVMTFNKKDSFISYIDTFVKINADKYRFSKVKNNDYKIRTFSFNPSDSIGRPFQLKELNNRDKLITENTLLVKRKLAYISSDQKCKLTYVEFNQKNQIAKLKVTLNGKTSFIYTDILNSGELTKIIEDNVNALSKINSDKFISQDDYQVYLVSKQFDINAFSPPQQEGDRDYKSVNLHLIPRMGDQPTIATGVPENHQKAINKVADKYNITIGIRPVDHKSASLIESGIYSSKGLTIKGKSSDWGPHSGFIPVLQQFSKKSGRDEQSKYNDYVQQSIDKKHAIAVPLEISSERINELINYKTITPLIDTDDGDYKKTSSTIDGEEHTFLLKKSPSGKGNIWQVSYQENNEIKPFLVIGDPKTGKAMTADYDIFSIIFPISELEHYVKVTEMPDWQEWKASVNYEELTPAQKRLYNNEAEYNKKEGKENGIINNRIKEVNRQLNRELGRTEGFELVHHGSDDANPVSVMKDNFPITFFLPESLKGKNKLSGTTQPINTYFEMNAHGAIIINDVEQLSNFQQLLINQGYRAPLNRKWSQGENGELFEPKRKKSEGYIVSHDKIKRKKSISILNDNIEQSPDNSEQGSNKVVTDNKVDKVLIANRRRYIERLFGKSVIGLDNDFFDIHENNFNDSHHASLAGDLTSKAHSINTWCDPIKVYQQLMAINIESGANRQANPTEYDHNVIIQIQGDEVSAEAVAKSLSKHPDNSTVIQYDLTSRKHKVLYGSLDQITTGKVRWLTIGHGSYSGNNQPTLYAGRSAKQYTDAMTYLKKKVLKNTIPDKLVLMGCNLGRGGINENFALKAVSLFANNKMNMPIVAYNRRITNFNHGHKMVLEGAYNSIQNSTKGYKFTYQYDLDIREVKVNGKYSVLYFINELQRGELKLSQFNSYIEPDPMKIFRHSSPKELDFALIRKIAYNPQAYQLFVDELKQHSQGLPSDFHSSFTKKLNELGITSTPIWRTVNQNSIAHQAHLDSHLQKDTSTFSIIVRVVADIKGRVKAEQLAGENPENTLILQADTDKKIWVVEYGENNISSLLESGKTVKWVIIGNDEVQNKPSDSLLSVLAEVKQKYPFTAPEHMSFHSTNSKTMQFTSSLFVELEQRKGATVVRPGGTYQGGGETSTIKNYLDTKHHQQVQSLIEKIASKDISLEHVRLAEHPYLVSYFDDGYGQFSADKLKVALYDPLIAPKVNHYLSNDKIENKAHWDNLFEARLPVDLQQQAKDTLTILHAIQDDPSVLHHLSEKTRLQLKAVFPAINGFDRGKVTALAKDVNAFLLMSEDLNSFLRLNKDNFDGENAPLKGVSFAEALHKHQVERHQRLQQYNELRNQMHKWSADSQVNMINYDRLRRIGDAADFDRKMGLIYTVESQLGDENSARNLIEWQIKLEQKRYKGTLTEGETELLNEIKRYSNDIVEGFDNKGEKQARQSIEYVLSANNKLYHSQNSSLLFIQGNNTTYTIHYTARGNIHEYSLLDPNGLQLSIRNEQRYLAKQLFAKQVNSYFNENVSLLNGETITRGQQAGFGEGSDNSGKFYSADMQFITLDENSIKRIPHDYEQYRKKVTALINSVAVADKNSWVNFNGEKIALVRLQNLGVTIDGQLITADHTKKNGWQKKVRFHPEKLAAELTLVDGNESDLVLLRILHQQLGDVDHIPITDNNAGFRDSAVLKKQLKYIARNIDPNVSKLTPEMVENLRTLGTKLPRFQQIGNRFGQVMGGVGAVQTLISIHLILKKLDSPDLTDEECAELEKQFYLICGSAIANYGDMIVQPILLNIASKGGTTSLIRGRIAAGTVIIFNLVGMGFDAYQAYDSLSKLDRVSDPKQRQDLIVNATFSIASFVLNGITIIGVIVGSSTIPVVGLVVGGVLLVSGMVYQGIRAVENIKEVIDISWDRELEEGFRGAFGFEPTLRSQQEMTIVYYTRAFKKLNVEMDIDLFEKMIVPAGFDHHLSIIEKPTYKSEERYYLVDELYNYFGGIEGEVRLSSSDYTYRYTKRGAPSFTSSEADFLIKNYSLTADGRARRVTGLEDRVVFRKVSKDVLDVVRTGAVASNEGYCFNPNYNNPLFDKFLKKHGIQKSNLTQSTENQLVASDYEQLSFYSKQTEVAAQKNFTISKYADNTDEYVENKPGIIANYLDIVETHGSSFNLANGVDYFIGRDDRMYALQVLSGEKYFATGSKSDYFYLRDNSLTSLESNDGKVTKFLDGQSGSDTLLIDNLPNGYHVYIDLRINKVAYRCREKSKSIDVVHVENIENIIIIGNTDDIIHGDDENNNINSGGGKDTLYGHGGDDKLTLAKWKAIGGSGTDSYVIKRFEWAHHVDDLYKTKTVYNKKTFRVEKEHYINSIYRQENKKFQAYVIIEENSQSVSRVDIEYSLNEIKDVYIQGNDLYLKIQVDDYKTDKYVFDKVKSEVTIKLNNVYRDIGGVRKRNHSYNLNTKDGFALISQLVDLPKEKHPEYAIRGKLFNALYVQHNDKMPYSGEQSVYIDEGKDEIEVNKTRVYRSPKWGTLVSTGKTKNLIYTGSEKSNILSHIASGSHIKVTLGKDIYQINELDYKNKNIVFDFANVKGHFTDQDKVIILLPTVNGYQLQMNGQKLLLKDRFEKTTLSIRFENFDGDMNNAVLIQDKYSNMFCLDLKSENSVIVPLNPIADSTDGDDTISIPEGYLGKKLLINGQAGNDIILDHSGFSRVLIGGDGDDTITAVSGNNVLYAGSGMNFLSGGGGDDLLLSDLGDDTLMGKEGDDNYLIDCRYRGVVYIEDLEGKNNIHLLNFDCENITEGVDNGALYRIYISKSDKIIKIRQPSLQENKDAVCQVYMYPKLPHKLQELTKEGMGPLVKYFADSYSVAEKTGQKGHWKLVDTLTHLLNGTPDALLESLHVPTNGPTILNPNYARTHWLIKTKEGNLVVLDHTGHGRIIQGGKGDNRIVTLGGNNVLFGGQGNDILVGGVDKDLLISVAGNDTLSGGLGNDTYLVNGYESNTTVKIEDLAGRNQVVLVNFHVAPVKVQQIDSSKTLSVYESYTGRKVEVYHSNHLMSMADVTDIKFRKCDGDEWNGQAEQTVDKLIQLYAELRFEYESTFETTNMSAHLRNRWDPLPFMNRLLEGTSVSVAN
ncbi:anthrax toxin-like adenylyl cyclase domain-containing protein [Providencia huashanensis]|uniref:anthrax toxin-like adenylyl cyclase domain-containing protein n=1 Tax=Providencia huashanensis TaxID=3037798 RepID=UPI002AFF1887|nr:anthrax toxin-like adenylyl cyclase domain-containing protein [Providencia sp. 23021821]